ncbi:hypothetical protein [Streptomyces cinereoruber]|uniref:hypothetical protein n=1 Tax=Streptomyces cinereoruber TaxID=67260 RepID=UPI00363774DF
MTTTNETKTWIVTGASPGLGPALAAGEHVIGTARQADRFDGLDVRYGDQPLSVEHDVRDTGGAAAVVQRALEVFGRVDVLHTARQSPVYDEVVGAARANMAEADGVREGDPARAARVIRDVLDAHDAPLRLPLGAEAVRNLTRVYRGALDDVGKRASVSGSADFPGMPPAVRAF